MLVVKTRPTLDSWKKYWWSKKRSKGYIVSNILFLLFELFQLAISLLAFIMTGKGLLYILITLVLMAGFVVLLVRVCYMPRKLFNNSQKLCNDTVETLTFGENSFTAENIGSRINETVTNIYSSVTSVKHSDGWFIIVCDNYRFYVFRDNEFVEGSPLELQTLLHSKTGKI